MTEIAEMTTRFGQPFLPPPAPRVEKSMFLFSNLKPGDTVSFCHDGEYQGTKYGKVVRTFWDEARKKITHEISMQRCGKLIYWNDLEPRSRDDRFIKIKTCRPLYDPKNQELLSRVCLEADEFVAPVLRFGPGDRVIVFFQEGQYLARVLMTWFVESDGGHWPYQVQLENGEKIRGTSFCCVTEDHPSFITSFEEWSSRSEEMQKNLLDEIENEERADSNLTSKRSEKKRRKKNKKAAKKGEAEPVISEMQSLEIGEDDKDEEKEEPTPPPPTPPVEDKAAGDDTCIICLENIKTHASIPCGHFLLCGNCVSKQVSTSTRCPYCFEENVTWVHIRF